MKNEEQRIFAFLQFFIYGIGVRKELKGVRKELEANSLASETDIRNTDFRGLF